MQEIEAPHLSFQESNLLLQIPNDSVSLLNFRPGVLQLYYRTNTSRQRLENTAGRRLYMTSEFYFFPLPQINNTLCVCLHKT